MVIAAASGKPEDAWVREMKKHRESFAATHAFRSCTFALEVVCVEVSYDMHPCAVGCDAMQPSYEHLLT